MAYVLLSCVGVRLSGFVTMWQFQRSLLYPPSYLIPKGGAVLDDVDLKF